jgi:hypothetical protein
MPKCTYCETDGEYKFVRGKGYLCSTCCEKEKETQTQICVTCINCSDKMKSGFFHPSLGLICANCILKPNVVEHITSAEKKMDT